MPGHRSAPRETAILVGAVVLGMSPWFSATVVAPALVRDLGNGVGSPIALTLSVQFGFVLGSLVSALLLLADRWSPRRLAAGSALFASVATAALTLPGVDFTAAVALRALAGAAMAGVYPPGIKIAAGWTRDRRGLAIGLLVAGTVLGAAVPHLLRAFANPDEWRGLVLLAAACAFVAALIFALRVREGPYQSPSAPFNLRALGAVFRNRGVMLSTGGYLGHMWELYAMWSSIGVFWAYVGEVRGWPVWAPALAAFATVSSGAAGSIYAGLIADRVGRATVTIVAMGVSGACGLIIGPLLGAPIPWLVLLALVWGASIVADSAQFSASVTEFADPSYVGTAVTVQTALGFLLTMVTISLVPFWTRALGWSWAYAPLAIGPFVGCLCMWRLRGMENRGARGARR